MNARSVLICVALTSSSASPRADSPESFAWRPNLQRFLNLLETSPEFQQSKVILTRDTKFAGLVESFVDDHFASRSFDLYRASLSTPIEIRSRSRFFTGKILETFIWIIVTKSLEFSLHTAKSDDRIVVVHFGDCRVYDAAILNKFRSLWNQRRIYAMISTSACDHFGSFLSYSPVSKSPAGFSRTMLMEDPTAKRMFEDLADLNGNTLNVSVVTSAMMVVRQLSGGRVQFQGSDSVALRVIEGAMNASFAHVVVKELDGDPFRAGLDLLSKGRVEMVLTPYFQKLYGQEATYEFTNCFAHDELCLIVPSGGVVAKCWTPFLPFTNMLWLALAVTCVALRVLWILMKRGTRALPGVEGLRWRSSSRLPWFVEYLVQILEQNIPTSVSPAPHERVFVMSILFFHVIVTGSHHSGLVSILNKPPLNKDMNTLEEVADSELVIGTRYENLAYDTFSADDPVEKRLFEKVHLLRLNASTSDMVAFDRNITVFHRKSFFYVDNFTRYYDEDNNFLLHVVEECPVGYMLGYVVRRGSPYRHRLNDVVLRLQESGLYLKWLQDEWFTNNMHVAMYVPNHARWIELELGYFHAAFGELGVGLLLSLIIFFYELSRFSKSQGHSRRRPRKRLHFATTKPRDWGEHM